MQRYIALDIGGTEIKYAIIDNNATLIVHDRMETPQGDARLRITGQAAGIIGHLLQHYKGVQGVGISTAGVVNPESGEIVFAGGTIPDYKGANLKAMVEEQFGLAAHVANDVNAAACGEKWMGAAKGYDSFFCITLGTGIGGAMYCKGSLVIGEHYRAGELGHSLYDKLTGTTYEQRASMSALMRRAKIELRGFSGCGHELFQEARGGNAAYDALIESWAEEIAKGLAQVALIADPAMIVIGGGVSEQGDYLLSKIRRHTHDYMPEGLPETPLRMAELGNRAALFGAVYPYFIL
ncbi:ROK family protein [Paenibacillus sp. LHD-117]|uniref:ROK family protein n=1 Tax=Paenibacillus sp. LHD-117 TaxID=3071412 RepID=UPI0027DFC3F1|nr:ROK family protein [Paenibacillus sp. LHD-117]MDQ6422974.1 ROK family protein [Paenibacillus sp. LHD-117]